MVTKLISLVVSFVMSFTGFGSAAVAESIKCILLNAYSLVAERSDFIEDIDESSVSLFSENSGYDFLVVQSAGNGNGPGNPIDSGQNGCFYCVNERTALAPMGISKQDILDRIIIVCENTKHTAQPITADSCLVLEEAL